MKIVIDISDRLYKVIQEIPISGFELLNLVSAVRKGTPLPKGHGRLIDADALVYSLSSSDRDIYCKAVIEEEAPTIIEADKESEE